MSYFNNRRRHGSSPSPPPQGSFSFNNRNNLEDRYHRRPSPPPRDSRDIRHPYGGFSRSNQSFGEGSSRRPMINYSPPPDFRRNRSPEIRDSRYHHHHRIDISSRSLADRGLMPRSDYSPSRRMDGPFPRRGGERIRSRSPVASNPMRPLSPSGSFAFSSRNYDSPFSSASFEQQPRLPVIRPSRSPVRSQFVDDRRYPTFEETASSRYLPDVNSAALPRSRLDEYEEPRRYPHQDDLGHQKRLPRGSRSPTLGGRLPGVPWHQPAFGEEELFPVTNRLDDLSRDRLSEQTSRVVVVTDPPDLRESLTRGGGRAVSPTQIPSRLHSRERSPVTRRESDMSIDSLTEPIQRRKSGSRDLRSRSRSPLFSAAARASAEKSTSVSLGKSSVIANQLVRVREYINGECGILEMPKQPDKTFPSVFFHIDSVFVTNEEGNPYGPPIKIQAQHVSCLAPMGADLMFNGYSVVDHPFVNFVATAVWPKTTEPPKEEQNPVEVEKRLKEFTDYYKDREPVIATFHGLQAPRLAPASASIWEIFDNEYGMIETKVTKENDRFFALFHREDLYLKDGKRAIDHVFFKDKPLKDIVRIGQLCNFSARSVVLSKGYHLKPSIMELQAIVVSLNPDVLPHSAPRATRLRGGPGTYRVSRDFSPYFFEQGLLNKLNHKLATFIKTQRKKYVDLDAKCLEIIEEKKVTVSDQPDVKKKESPSRIFPSVLTNEIVQVQELLTNTTGVLAGKNWKCFFTSVQVLIAPGTRLQVALKPGTRVLLNATLMDDKMPLQYMANLVWFEKDFLGRDMRSENREIGPTMQQKYEDVNELLAMDTTDDNQSSKKNEKDKSSLLPEYYDKEIGTVFSILDENFAVIRVNSTLILFDNCDFWVGVGKTAQKENKKIDEVVNVGTRVQFHASLLKENAKIQYLASSVWYAENSEFTSDLEKPKPIVRSKIHSEKINIYNSVVEMVSDSLPSMEDLMPMDGKDVEIKKSGIVRLVFNKGVKLEGGIIEFDSKKYCFFPSEHLMPLKEKVKAGVKVVFNAARIHDLKMKANWTEKINFIALTVYENSEMHEDLYEAKKRLKKAVEKFDNIIKAMIPNIKFLDDLSHPRWPVVNIPGPGQKLSNDPKMTGASKQKEVPTQKLKAKFKCLFENETSGLLEVKDESQRFIYFELADLNVENLNEIPQLELISLLNNLTGVDVVCYAVQVMKSGSDIGLAALDRGGVQILGDLPKSASMVKRFFTFKDKEMTSVFENKEKMKRFQLAEEAYKKGEILTWLDITRKEREKFQKRIEETIHKKMSENIIQQEGTVKQVLNDYFGLIRGPAGAAPGKETLCLFDTYDLHIAEGQTANESDLAVGKVLSVGDSVMYNACLVEQDCAVPYLATGVWKPGVMKALEPVAKSTIQQAKIDIYHTVVKSCASILAPKEKEKEIDRETSSVKKGEQKKVSNLKEELLRDHETIGNLSAEKSERFGIVSLHNGKKALLETNRVWLNEKPKFGGWRALYLSYFKTLNVNARKVEGFKDFEYQVIFTHSGFYKKNLSSGKFDYTPKMISWIKTVTSYPKLDEELTFYKNAFESK